MTDADLYRAAAKEVAEVMYEHAEGEKPQHKACCTAIWDVGGDRAADLRIRFADFFQPAGDPTFWFGKPENPKNREPRVLALCFMAAIAESGDL